METKKTININVFPTGKQIQVCEQGMTLRDHLAGLAMQGHISSEYGAGIDCDNENRIYIARACYIMADAMLKVREETES